MFYLVLENTKIDIKIMFDEIGGSLFYLTSLAGHSLDLMVFTIKNRIIYVFAFHLRSRFMKRVSKLFAIF